MKNQNAPKGMLAKPDFENSHLERFDLSRLRGFRLFAVVVDTRYGASVYGVYADPRDAREHCRILCNPPPARDFKGDFVSLPVYRCKVLSLEFPRHYFK